MAESDAVRKLADTLANIDRRITLLERGGRQTQLSRSSLEDATLDVNSNGVLRSRWGLLDDGTVAVKYVNGPAPATPSPPVLDPRQLGLAIYWDGLFADGAPRPADVQRVDVHMSDTPGFTPDGNTVVGSLIAESVLMPFASIVPQYVKFVAVTTSDVASIPTADVSATPLPAEEIAAGSIGADQIAAGAITASKLESDLVLATRLSLQDGLGNTTVDMDGTTGNVLISGELTTSHSGERVVINPDNAGNPAIRLYPATGERYGVLNAFTAILNDVDYGGIQLRGGYQDGGTDTGRLTLQPDSVQINFGDAAGTYSADFTCLKDNLWITAGNQVSLESETGVVWIFGGDEVEIGNQSGGFTVKFRNDGVRPYIVGNNTNSGIYFGNGRVFSVNDSAANGPFTCTNLGYTSQTNVSTREAKRDIQPLSFSALDVLTNAPAFHWKYKESIAGDDSDRPHIGPVAEDLPDVLLVHDDNAPTGLDLTSQLGVMWEAIRELSTKVDELISPTA
jgi:hypothetical protein